MANSNWCIRCKCQPAKYGEVLCEVCIRGALKPAIGPDLRKAALEMIRAIYRYQVASAKGVDVTLPWISVITAKDMLEEELAK